jgi:hypothetical protein
MLDGLRKQFDCTTSARSEEIKLLHGVIFADSRAHFVYSDKTALVLHPRGDCFTYYSKTGQKTRQLVSFAVNSAARETTSG